MPVEESSEKASIDLGLSVTNLKIKIPSLGLEFANLTGDGTFLSPHFLVALFRATVWPTSFFRFPI